MITRYTNWGGETIPRPFFKKTKLGTSRDQCSKVYTDDVYSTCWWLSRYIGTKL